MPPVVKPLAINRKEERKKSPYSSGGKPVQSSPEPPESSTGSEPQHIDVMA